MSLYVSTNSAAVKANFHLGRNSSNLQKSLTRLASGNRITQPADDAGGLAVSMKLKASINRLAGAEKNIQNAVSFLEVQDGVLQSVGMIVDRMSELKGLSRDVMKNVNDQATYNNEFRDLQVQLYEMAATKFNGVSLFARYANADSSGNEQLGVFSPAGRQDRSLDNTMTVYTSESGDAGTKVSIHKVLLLSALTMRSVFDETNNTHPASGWGDHDNSQQNDSELNDFVFSLASEKVEDTVRLDSVSVNVFLTALENISALRAQNGASMSRLNFQAINLSRQRTNMEAANGRIVDVDMGAESTRMAKYNVLTQSAASMLAHANTTPDVALILLR
jgi:flagellin